MTRARGELPEPEEALLGIERPSVEEEEAEAKRLQERRDLRKVVLLNCMRQEEFRAWLMEKLQGFQTFGQPFAVSPVGFPDPHATFFHAGMKAAGWSLWEELDELCPDLASLMRREARGKV